MDRREDSRQRSGSLIKYGAIDRPHANLLPSFIGILIYSMANILPYLISLYFDFTLMRDGSLMAGMVCMITAKRKKSGTGLIISPP
jgi:hypothetical protein